MMLYPEKRQFASAAENGTMVAIYSTIREDLYVVYAGRNPDNFNPIIHVYLNPLVKWIWFGGLVVVLGTILALIPSRQAALSLRATALQPALASPSPQMATASLRSDHAD